MTSCPCLVSRLVTRVHHPYVMKLPEVIYNIWVPSRGSVFRQMREVPRKPVPACAVFLVPTARHNQRPISYLESEEYLPPGTACVFMVKKEVFLSVRTDYLICVSNSLK